MGRPQWDAAADPVVLGNAPARAAHIAKAFRASSAGSKADKPAVAGLCGTYRQL